jgi:hypothetical protein
MNEEVLAAIFRGDEAVPLLIAEPLHGANSHLSSLRSTAEPSSAFFVFFVFFIIFVVSMSSFHFYYYYFFYFFSCERRLTPV